MRRIKLPECIRLDILIAKASGCHQQVVPQRKPRDSCDGYAGRVPITIGNRPEVTVPAQKRILDTQPSTIARPERTPLRLSPGMCDAGGLKAPAIYLLEL